MSPRLRRRYGPLSRAVVLLCLTGGIVACVVGTVQLHQQGSRSSYVQNHGAFATGTVVSVDNFQYCVRSCHWTAHIPVTLGSPALGVSTTTVHYHARSYLASGERVSVLVDPRDPAYAELPGYPFTKSSDWIPAGLFALFMAALAAYDAVLLARQLSHRRRHAAGRVSMADA